MEGGPLTIGRYRIVNRIGRGGMGTLYLAWDPLLERQVAIKLLIDDDDELRERFSREARSAARLHHPNIVTMYDVGEEAGRPFMAMEYIEGETLAEIIRRREPLTDGRKLQLAEALVDGLAFAHRAGIVHRDIKPANIMVDVAGTLKILDFGIARLAQSSGITRVGAQIGTLNYMSPEQLVGQPVDHRSDIFSVGAVCYELFAYRQAFPGGIHTGLLHRLLNGQTEPLGSLCPALDPEIVRIVHRCLEANVERRYPDLAAVQKDLAKVRARLASEETLAPAADLAGPGSETASGSSSGSTARRLVDRTELARRRANQIERHLRAASDAFASGNFDGTVAECERVLMLDAEQPQALELLDRARAAIDERHADALAQEAEAELQRGALAVAGAKLDEAQALSPASRRAADGRAALDRALAERDEVRRRRRALADCVADARRCFARGAFEEAIAALDQALALEPAHEEAVALRTRAVAAAADVRAREELAASADRCVSEARRLFDAGEHDAALRLLAAFEPGHERVSAAREELQAEARRLDASVGAVHIDPGDAAAIAHVVAGAGARFARGDARGAAASLRAALAADPAHEAALALLAKVEAALRLDSERRRRREQDAQERQRTLARYLEAARRAPADADAVAALYRALEIAGEDAGIRKSLAEHQARITHQEAERQAAWDAERAQRERLDAILHGVRHALRAGDLAAARATLEQLDEADRLHPDARWLLEATARLP